MPKFITKFPHNLTQRNYCVYCSCKWKTYNQKSPAIYGKSTDLVSVLGPVFVNDKSNDVVKTSHVRQSQEHTVKNVMQHVVLGVLFLSTKIIVQQIMKVTFLYTVSVGKSIFCPIFNVDNGMHTCTHVCVLTHSHTLHCPGILLTGHCTFIQTLKHDLQPILMHLANFTEIFTGNENLQLSALRHHLACFHLI